MTMHKSNSIPVFSQEDAIEIATMRRGQYPDGHSSSVCIATHTVDLNLRMGGSAGN